MDAANIVVIIVALIGAIGTILSNIVIGGRQSRDFDAKLDKQQALTEQKLDLLTEEVKKHNGFAEKIPELKIKMEALAERISKLESWMEKNQSK